ncbi:MAG: GAF domain-containing protein [Acidobacteria bacterium]|nr:GAF domain-containing protein [Acidobacteriota bacterium]
MTPSLDSLAPCFQGLIPAMLFTCSAEGVPNAAYLSHVDYVDASHVALSFQFFNKSRRNIAENPKATVRVLNPDTGQGWLLSLRFVRSETSGALFDRMALRIESIASYCGLKGIFKLLAADVYEVTAVRPAEECGASPEAVTVSGHVPADPVFTMQALQHMSARIHAAESLEQLLDSILAGFAEVYGFTHSMLALATGESNVLVTVASRGYSENGAGAEVRFGEGIMGMVAEARKPIRISGLLRGMLYAQAVKIRAQQAGMHAFDARVPLPGLANPESQLGIPLLVRGDLIGVLCIESETPYRFHEDDKTSIELLGSYLAIAVQHMQLHERADVVASTAVVEPPQPAPKAAAPASQPGRAVREVVFYSADECILVDGEYLIRSLPARILWKLLSARMRDGRAEFTNRELRLDKSLNLPEWKDNLETRLLLLRRRLEQKCPDIRVVPRGRGRFGVEVGCQLVLAERP